MGFHQIAAKQGGLPVPTNSVRVRLAANPKNSSSLGLDVFISRDVAKRLGWKIGGRIQFLFGRDDSIGAHAGKLRLEAFRGNGLSNALSTGKNKKNSTGRIRATTARLPEAMKRMPPCTFDAEFEVRKTNGGCLTITLPFTAFDAAAETGTGTKAKPHG